MASIFACNLGQWGRKGLPQLNQIDQVMNKNDAAEGSPLGMRPLLLEDMLMSACSEVQEPCKVGRDGVRRLAAEDAHQAVFGWLS